MDSNEMPVDQVSVKIDRGKEDGENEPVILVFEELGKLKISLSESTTEDITTLFNEVFDYISNKKALVEFKLDDAENDLFNHVSQDIIDQLNAEIRDSQESFEKIWQLVT